jgi:Ca2+-binding EF-hand superfamily protein
MKEWASRDSLSAEDAFRIMDRDFGGTVSKSELEYFFVHVLHQSPKEVTASRINRLFKLMDFFKRG